LPLKLGRNTKRGEIVVTPPKRALLFRQESFAFCNMNSSPDTSGTLSAPEKKIARRLAQLRQDRGMTLRELSEQTGFSESYLSRVENLKMPVSIANLAKFAEVFGASIASFFDQDAS